jgi:hypothetical protein
MRLNWIAVFAAVLLAVASSVRADDAPDNAQFARYAQRLFAGKVAVTGKSYACFTRGYDAAHLTKHPKQKVKAMRLLVSAEMLPEDKQLNYSFQLGVDFRDRKGKFESSGSCGHPSAFQESADKMHLGCGVDCDGGGISIELANGDRSALIRLEQVAIWDVSKQDSERVGFDGGADDRLFRLERTSLDACQPLIDENKDTDTNS